MCASVGPQECNPNHTPAGFFCCLAAAPESDAGDDAAISKAGTCSAANAEVRATDYDQSCTSNSDCVEIYVGNPCSCEINCGTIPAAINKSVEPQYLTDVRNLPPISCACEVNPPFPVDVGPCCIAGTCQITQCRNPVPPDAATEAGADSSTDGGPADADACAQSGCTASCPSNGGTHNVSMVVNGCTIWQCCVPDDASADASGE